MERGKSTIQTASGGTLSLKIGLILIQSTLNDNFCHGVQPSSRPSSHFSVAILVVRNPHCYFYTLVHQKWFPQLGSVVLETRDDRSIIPKMHHMPFIKTPEMKQSIRGETNTTGKILRGGVVGKEGTHKGISQPLLGC